jgi:hypothetical protein
MKIGRRGLFGFMVGVTTVAPAAVLAAGGEGAGGEVERMVRNALPLFEPMDEPMHRAWAALYAEMHKVQRTGGEVGVIMGGGDSLLYDGRDFRLEKE